MLKLLREKTMRTQQDDRSTLQMAQLLVQVSFCDGIGVPDETLDLETVAQGQGISVFLSPLRKFWNT
jgi:hypothetical protein